MAVLLGKNADIYIVATGSATTFTGEATTNTSGTTYQITNTSKRRWDPTAAFTVYDGASPIAAGGYELIYATGKIVLAAAPAGAVTVTGKYMTTSQLGQATEWSLSVGPNLAPSHTFGDSWEEFTPTQKKGSASLKRFYADNYFFTNRQTLLLLELIEASGAGKYVCYGYPETAISAPVNGLIEESVTINIWGAIDFA